MMTYWILRSLKEMLKWETSAANTGKIEVTIKCAIDSDGTTELTHRHQGFIQVPRWLLLELLTVEELSRLELEAEFKLSVPANGDWLSKVDMSLKVGASLPNSKSARNLTPGLTEAISQARGAQEAESADREVERKRRKTSNPKDSSIPPRPQVERRKDRPGRGGREFPRR